MAKKHETLSVQGLQIRIQEDGKDDYFSLTDIAKYSGERTEIIIQNWLRNRNTVEFLGVWEQLNNPDFNHIEFDVIKSQAGLNAFTLSAKKWVSTTNAIGIRSKAGRYGGTYAHKDIALEFCSFLSPAFRLYLIKEFQRLKQDEARRQSLDWNVKRIMTKANFHILTEAVREHLVPPRIRNTRQEGIVFANETDLINVALFGQTAKQWRSENPNKKGNMRDYASAEQLLILSNLQVLNAKLMEWGSDTEQRLDLLNKTAIEQMNILIKQSSIGKLTQGE